MSRATLAELSAAGRIGMAVMFGLSRLSLTAARVLVLASHRLTNPWRHLTPEASE